MSNFDDVGNFHHKFGIHSVTHAEPGPVSVPAELVAFRIAFMEEELHEFKEAVAAGDTVKAADALIDLAYVTFGTAHVFGFPWQELWDEVQRANMTKERATRAEQSLRASTYDIIKPSGWRLPDIDGVLLRHGFDVGLGKVPPCGFEDYPCPALAMAGSRYCTVHSATRAAASGR